MPLSTRSQYSTLTQFLIEERRKYPSASGDFNALILDIALACKAIARGVALHLMILRFSAKTSGVGSRIQTRCF